MTGLTAASDEVALVGVIVTDYLGGMDKALQVLILLMILEYVIGLLGAVRQKRLNSEVVFWGGIRKAIILLVIGLAAMVDSWVIADTPVFRTIAIYFYAAREALTIFENIGVLGVTLPGRLRQFFEKLNEKEGDA